MGLTAIGWQIEQTQFHLGGVFREQGKVDTASTVPGRSQRIGLSGPDSWFHSSVHKRISGKTAAACPRKYTFDQLPFEN